jgi:septal ring factor EnvC (AmiA/AmiB activator)
VAGKLKQTNFRLPEEKYGVLEAAAYVEKADSVPNLVRALVEDAIQQYAQLATVQQAMKAQEEQLAAKRDKVTALPNRRSRADQKAP